MLKNFNYLKLCYIYNLIKYKKLIKKNFAFIIIFIKITLNSKTIEIINNLFLNFLIYISNFDLKIFQHIKKAKGNHVINIINEIY